MNNQLANEQSSSLNNSLELPIETQELRNKTRKLQLEIDEKNEIINILKDELESTKEQSDKSQRENIKLLKDSKRVKFLQDENDFLQDKVGNVDKLELEIKKLKEKLAETEFLKLRIGELEEDKQKSQESSAQFEDKWQKAEQKLTRVLELETELEKWISFSHELEAEKSLIESKLLESIDQEAKLNSTNKQLEDEVKRLRSLVRSYDEERDEEQASNSLIVDLNQLDQQQELQEENRNLKQKLSEFSIKLEGNKKLISDLRQDLACEKSLAVKLTQQLASFTKQIKNLDKQYFPMHDVCTATAHDRKLTSLSIEVNGNDSIKNNINNNNNNSNGISNDIENNNSVSNNKSSINDDDESSQLVESVTSVEVKKQVLPDADLQQQQQTVFNQKISPQQPQPPPQQQQPNQSTTKPIDKTKRDGLPCPNSSSSSSSKSTNKAAAAENIPAATEDKHPKVTTPCHKVEISNKVNKVPITTKVSTPTKGQEVASSNVTTQNCINRSHQQKPLANVSAKQQQPAKRDTADEVKSTDRLPRTASPKQQQPSQHRAFVRNSLPSRSVNYGHSKSSAYLDRIRASVTATTTTNTTTAASLNSEQQQQTRNLLPAQPTVIRGEQGASLVLNCMLNHPHTDRCFVDSRHLNSLQSLQQVSSDAPLLHHQPSAHNNHYHRYHVQPQHQQQQQPPVHPAQVSSRQVNALIDPVSQERLLMSLWHHQHHHHGAGLGNGQEPPLQPRGPHVGGGQGLIEGDHLIDRQMAHLASFHQQHFYHHLHKLHQMHHLHHMSAHHQQQQQQQQHQNQEGQRQPQQQSPQSEQVKPPRDLLYSGGSQFYAPSAEFEHQQLYAKQATTRMVEVQADASKQTNGTLRSSPTKHNNQHDNSNHHHHYLPQIDEVNGLPSVADQSQHQHQQHQRRSPSRGGVAQVVMTSDKTTIATSKHKSLQQVSSSNGSPTSASTSPTSSTSGSSNLSPSSASSSSSLNSLSNGCPLDRSSAVRHSTTERQFSQRQFSIERDLVGSSPLTATLSRVGSCRMSNRSVSQDREVPSISQSMRDTIDQRQLRHLSPLKDSSKLQQQQQQHLLRTPVKSQQPSMRTSKILNIGQHQVVAQQHHANQQQQQQQVAAMQHQQPQQTPLTTSSPTANQSAVGNRRRGLSQSRCSNELLPLEPGASLDRRLASNLASIRLNDSLAYTSLRAPKNSLGPNGLNRTGYLSTTPPNKSSAAAATHATNSNQILKPITQSAGKLNNNKTTTLSAAINSSGPSSVSVRDRPNGQCDLGRRQENGSGNEASSVWFEYGCV